jgi:hypothetical protein
VGKIVSRGEGARAAFVGDFAHAAGFDRVGIALTL